MSSRNFRDVKDTLIYLYLLREKSLFLIFENINTRWGLLISNTIYKFIPLIYYTFLIKSLMNNNLT